MISDIEGDVASGRVLVDPSSGKVYMVSTWAEVDLEPFKRGESIVDPPAFLPRSDGNCLIYPGRAHSFFGPAESLKSWAALYACKSVLDTGLTALYIDFEDDAISFVEQARVSVFRRGTSAGR